jgi:hypothetical protein
MFPRQRFVRSALNTHAFTKENWAVPNQAMVVDLLVVVVSWAAAAAAAVIVVVAVVAVVAVEYCWWAVAVVMVLGRGDEF